MSGNTLFAIFWVVVGAVFVVMTVTPGPTERVALAKIKAETPDCQCPTIEEVIEALEKAQALTAECPAPQDKPFKDLTEEKE